MRFPLHSLSYPHARALNRLLYPVVGGWELIGAWESRTVAPIVAIDIRGNFSFCCVASTTPLVSINRGSLSVTNLVVALFSSILLSLWTVLLFPLYPAVILSFRFHRRVPFVNNYYNILTRIVMMNPFLRALLFLSSLVPFTLFSSMSSPVFVHEWYTATLKALSLLFFMRDL